MSSLVSASTRQFVNHYRWAIALSLLVLVALIAQFHFTSMPESATYGIGAATVSLVDPAQQGVLGYIQAHSVARPVAALDATQQGVLGYIQAHTIAQAPVVLDATQQGVMGYIQAHTVAPQPLDPAQQSVLNYVRIHQP